MTEEEAGPVVGSAGIGSRSSTGAAASVATVAVGNAVARGLGFLFPLVVGRVLDRPDFAVILLYISTGFFVAELVLTGFPTALTRYLAAADTRWTPRAVTGAAIVGGVPLLAACIVAGAILATNAGLSIALTAVVIVGLTIDAYYFAVLRGLGRFRLLVGYRIAANATQLVLLVVLAALDLASVTSAVVLYALVYLIPIAVIELREPVVTPILPRLADVRAPIVAQMSRFAIPALVSGTAFGVIFGLDTYAVGVLAPTDLPDYAAARSLVMPMTLVPFAIGVVLMPRIAAATTRQRRDLGAALAATVGASALAVTAYAVLGDWLVALVYPSGFAGAAAFLTPLATALAVMGVYSVATQWSFGLGDSRRPAAAIVIGALVAVVGQIVLTSAYGGTGAAAAIALGAGVALAVLAISDVIRPIRPRDAAAIPDPSGAEP